MSKFYNITVFVIFVSLLYSCEQSRDVENQTQGGNSSQTTELGNHTHTSENSTQLPNSNSQINDTFNPNTAHRVDKTLLVLDSLVKPNQANSSLWKTNITRTVFNNTSTFFILKGELCLLVGEAKRLEPIKIIHPSASDYESGIYYDAITELNLKNCKSTDYAILELSKSYQKHGVSIKLDRLKIDAPTTPTLPFLVQLEPYAFNIGINKGQYVENHEGALEALELLASHRIQPIKSWISSNSSISGNNTSFMNFVGQFKNGPTNIPDGKSANLYANYSNRPWFYVADEPSEEISNQIQESLDVLKKNHPKVKRMVTTHIDYPVDGIDIYCPVMDHLQNREEYKGELWSYVSCMSHGCGENRIYLDNPHKFTPDTLSRSGVPDLTIDAPARDILAFFLIGTHLKLGALLYYDSITQWGIGAKGVNVFEDMYNFGGNGDGTLLYPDYKKKRALPSLRLLLIKEASLLADAAKSSLFDLSTYINSTAQWNIDESIRNDIYEHLKRKLENNL